MSDDEIRYGVRSVSTSTPGRTITSGAKGHVVIDSPSGPNEAMTTGEAFLAGIAACGVTLVQSIAKERSIDVGPLTCEITGVRLKSRPEDFDHLDVLFTYEKLGEQQARELTEGWQAR